MTRFPKRELAREAELYPVDPAWEAARPRTWGDCERAGWGEHSACPWVSCAYHLAYDVNERTGSIKENFPGRELDELPATCALREAANGGRTLEEVGELTNLTRARVKQLEARAGNILAAALGVIGRDLLGLPLDAAVREYDR